MTAIKEKSLRSAFEFEHFKNFQLNLAKDCGPCHCLSWEEGSKYLLEAGTEKRAATLKMSTKLEIMNERQMKRKTISISIAEEYH
jgi:hypothetical protein